MKIARNLLGMVAEHANERHRLVFWDALAVDFDEVVDHLSAGLPGLMDICPSRGGFICSLVNVACPFGSTRVALAVVGMGLGEGGRLLLAMNSLLTFF